MNALASITLAASLAVFAPAAFAQATGQPPQTFGQQPPGGENRGGNSGGNRGGNAGGGSGQAPLQLKPPTLVQHLPDAQNCPVPDWIVPGMRLTYFSSVAQVNDAAGSVGMVSDPNGNITDSQGNRYRHGTEVGMGTGGSGWDCIDVLAVEPGVVVMVIRQFANLNGMQGPCLASGSHVFFTHPSGCDFFIHPRLLGQLQQQNKDGIAVIRGAMEHRGATYNILLSSVEIPKTRLSSIYDLASGVQLSHNSAVEHDKGVTYRESGDNYEATRNTGRSLANNQFHGARKLSLPWQTMQVPQWARTMKRARYQGQRIDTGTPDMGLGRLTVNITVDFETMYVGQTFIAYQASLTQQFEGMGAMEPSKMMMATGPGAYDGLWMDPAVLSQLRTGQVIDSDPNTGVQVVVEHIGQGANGQPVVVIASGNQVYKVQATYSAADGRLLGSLRTERSPSTGGTLTFQMQLVGME